MKIKITELDASQPEYKGFLPDSNTKPTTPKKPIKESFNEETIR